MWFKKDIKPEKIKQKNIRKLRSGGIDTMENLPTLEYPDFRDAEMIAHRMIILHALFQLHLQAPKDIIQRWLDENNLTSYLTEQELSYLNTSYSNLPEQHKINIYRSLESVWTFAWIGGLHNNLTLNTEVGHSLVTLLPNIQKNESAKTLISHFKLRNKKEIFETLDKFYRAHWFARNLQLTNDESNLVDLDIIIERRKALEYVSYKNTQWEEISLDT